MFNVYLQIDLNDHLAYVGPSGGKHLTIISLASRTKYDDLNIDQETSQIYNGEEFMPCQNNQTWVIYPTNLKIPFGSPEMSRSLYQPLIEIFEAK